MWAARQTWVTQVCSCRPTARKWLFGVHCIYVFGRVRRVQRCFLISFLFSLGVEPLYPQLCTRYPAVPRAWTNHGPLPMELSVMLLSVPCALSFSRHDNVSVIQLISIVSAAKNISERAMIATPQRSLP